MPDKNSYDPFGAELRRLANNLDRRNIKPVHPGFGAFEVRKRDLNIFAKDLNEASQKFTFSQNSPQRSPVSTESAPSDEAFGTFKKDSLTSQNIKLNQDSSFSVPSNPEWNWKPNLNANTEGKAKNSPFLGSPSFTKNPFSFNFLLKFLHSQLARRIGLGAARHALDLFLVAMVFVGSVFVSAILFAPASQSIDSRWKQVMVWQPVQTLLRLGIIEFLVIMYVLFFVYVFVMRFVLGRTIGSLAITANDKSSHTSGALID